MAAPLIYAIGDLHGCLRELDKLLSDVEKDAGGRPYRLVFLGDYINRGPNSKGVIDRLVELQKRDWEYPPVFLKGNHDDGLLRITYPDYKWSLFRMRSDKAVYERFMKHGGNETFMSYKANPMQARNHFEGAASLREMMPAQHRKFLEGLTLSFQTETHFFCHAGVDFSRPLDKQTPRDLMWARDAFVRSAQCADKIIVHGHTIAHDFKPHVHPNRIGVDTGAYKTGVLTACVINGAEPARFIMTRW